MPDETTVAGQITDAVTQTNVKVLSDAPADAVANLFIASAQATGQLLANATYAQNQSAISAQAATAASVSFLLNKAGGNAADLFAHLTATQDTKKD